MVGARLAPELEDFTVMPNIGSDFLVLPSGTEIWMFDHVPALVGVPQIWPVPYEKPIHEGRLRMVKLSRAPFASRLLGLKEYFCPTVAVLGGVPEMTGAELVAAVAIPENAPSAMT